MRIDQLYDVLVSPVVSEKATESTELLNKYTFKVWAKATKAQVTVAVEKIFNVKVVKVNILRRPAKKRMFKRVKGVIPGFKKAIVTLKKGCSLNIVA